MILENVSRRPEQMSAHQLVDEIRFLADEWKVVASLLDGNRSCFLAVSFDYEHGARSNWRLSFGFSSPAGA